MGLISSIFKQKSIDIPPIESAFNNSSRDAWWHKGYTLNRLQYEYKNLAYTCMNIRAQEVARYEPIFYATNPRIGRSDPLEDHPFLQLLDDPSPEISKYELFERTTLSLDNYGLAYWYIPITIAGKPAMPGQDGWGVVVVDPWRVQPIYIDGTNTVAYYRISTANGGTVDVEVNEILCFRYPRNLGIVEANLLYIDTENETSEFQNSFMRNSATPSGVAMIKGSITKEAYDKLKLQWRDQQQGAKNAGRTLFIRNGDFTFERLGLSIAELDLGRLKDLTKDEVRTAFRVPKPKLGDIDGQGLGRSGAETVNYIFARDVIDNIQLRYDDVIQRYIRRVYGDRIFVDHVSQIPEDQEFLLKQDVELVDKVFTRDEIRQRRGFDPTDGGDQLYVQMNMVPITDSQPDTTTVKGLTVKQTIKRPLELNAPVEKRSTKTIYFDRLDRLENLGVKRYVDTIGSLLKRQQRQVISQLKGSMKSLADDTAAGIATAGVAENWAKKLVKNIYSIVQQSGDLSLEYLGSTNKYVLEQTLRDNIESNTQRLMLSFNEETAKAIEKQISLGVEQGEQFEQLVERVNSVYSDAQGYRAERIARTETHLACNEGAHEAFKQDGITHLQWQTDADPCEYCAAMEGTITEIDTPFLSLGDSFKGIEGGEFTVDYVDVENADLHPNCACRLVPVRDYSASIADKIIVRHIDDDENQRLREALEKSEAFNMQLKELIDDGQ